MEKEKRIEMMQEMLDKINDDKLRGSVEDFLCRYVPDYFFTVAASSTGKYHPSFDQGEGGLVRHTRMVVEVIESLFRLYDYSSDARDAMIAACILHDTFKNGLVDEDDNYNNHTVDDHADIAANQWKKYYHRNLDEDDSRALYYFVEDGIRCHMGKWGRVAPSNKMEELVALADYIASRKFFDFYLDK